jgi:hypothetical protein
MGDKRVIDSDRFLARLGKLYDCWVSGGQCLLIAPSKVHTRISEQGEK